MNLAYTMAPGRGDTDLILHRLASRLAARGFRCCGTVQINSERADAGPCDMDVQVLAGGPVLRISQDLGPLARGCRLDPAALETAAGLVSASLARGADILIVNKFGKHEAEGRGFRTVIAEALALGIPVIAGVNALNLPAFEQFAEGLASRLPPDCDALVDWAIKTIRPATEAA
jgi:glycosyltransferase involved in cell wall biosynthesis